MRIIVILSLAIINLSCSNTYESKTIRLKDGHILKVDFYPNGAKKSEQKFLKEGNRLIEDGVLLKYNDSGFLVDSVNFAKGKKEGVERTYFEDGIRKSGSIYKNGVLDSLNYLLYRNGKMQELNYREEGVLWGLQYRFDSSGKIEKVIFAHPVDSEAFIMEFSSDGELLKTEGIPLYVLEHDHNARVGTAYRVLNLVPQFRQFKSKLRIIVSNGNSIIKDEVVSNLFPHMNAFGYIFEYSFSKLGEYEYRGIVDFYNEKTQEIISRDTVLGKVIVR